MDAPDVHQDDASTPAPDASQPHFRTYASDVAALTGKSPAPHIPHTSALHTTSIASAPATSATVLAPAPVAKPYDPPPASIIPKAPTTEESRDAVLERLRATAASRNPAPPPAPTPIPAAPSTNEAREEVLARLKSKAPPVKPTPVSPAPLPPGIPAITKTIEKNVPKPAPIHTYKSDFSQKAKTEQASPLSILAAEQNAQGSAEHIHQLKPQKKNYLPLILGSFALIIAGATSVYFAFTFVIGRPSIIVPAVVPSLIFADEHIELRGTGTELQQGLINLSSKERPPGSIAVAYITFASTSAKGTTVMLPADGGALISSLGLSAPDILLRNIDPSSTVGVVHAGNETRPFFILRVASFERTFAGMLVWEATMRRDLESFYPAYPVETVAIGTTTASSTPRVETPFRVSFIDDVVDNHDVRVLYDQNGQALILYGYRDKETLIIARDENAFSELLKRLASTRSK